MVVQEYSQDSTTYDNDVRKAIAIYVAHGQKVGRRLKSYRIVLGRKKLARIARVAREDRDISGLRRKGYEV